MHAGDSHTMALTQQGFIYGWGTFRNSSGVFSFSAQERLALQPVLVYSPENPARQAAKIVSGQDIQTLCCLTKPCSCCVLIRARNGPVASILHQISWDQALQTAIDQCWIRVHF